LRSGEKKGNEYLVVLSISDKLVFIESDKIDRINGCFKGEFP